MKKLENITVLKGDGIGPEVVNEAIKVMEACAQKYSLNFTFTEKLMGAVAIDATGNPLPDETLESCKSADAVLLGAIGDPRFDNDPSLKVRPEQGLLALRKGLGLFANIRPLKIFDSLRYLSVLKPEQLEGVDLIIYRELTGGIYFGKRETTDDFATDECKYHEFEIERIAKLAFEKAQQRPRKTLCLIDKANVLDTSRLWRKVVQGMASSYPDVKLDYLFVDNAAMQLILNPAQFDVILTSNMFGDIISDEASILGGSLGLLPSSSAGEKARLYEPSHGSYPQATGKNIANPLATILSVEMMFRDFGYDEIADDVMSAVQFVIDKRILTPDLEKENPVGTDAVGDAVSKWILEGV